MHSSSVSKLAMLQGSGSIRHHITQGTHQFRHIVSIALYDFAFVESPLIYDPSFLFFLGHADMMHCFLKTSFKI
jgi:hypothetical protein